MILDEDAGESHLDDPPSETTQPQTPIDQGTVGQKMGKPSMRERLNHISGYRIHPCEISSILETIGRGGKAEVVRARFEHSRSGVGRVEDVAVKKVACGSHAIKREKASKEFVHEVEILAGLCHENIVRLIGFVEDLDRATAWIVLSWEPNGNLREFVASEKREVLERLSLIQDTFRGLKYLHTRKPPICHGDLKSLNILVSCTYHAVITDFGSSRALRNIGSKAPDSTNLLEMSRTSTTEEETAACNQITVVTTRDQLTLTGPAWSLRWAAPEVVRDGEQPSLPSDIWSAGWVCWEVITGEIPFHDIKTNCAVMLQVIQGKVPSTHKNAQLAQVLRLCSLVADCWELNPTHRPTVARCCDEIDWMCYEYEIQRIIKTSLMGGYNP